MKRQQQRAALEEWLRLAYSPQAGCPPPESYQRAAAGELAPEEIGRLDEHAARCPACSAERDLALAFEAPPETAASQRKEVDFVVSRLQELAPGQIPFRGREAPLPRPLRFPRLPWPRVTSHWRVAAAAGLILLFGVAVQILRSPAPTLPEPEADDVIRGSEVEPIYPIGELEGMPIELRWKEVDEAQSYRVSLLGVDETILWEVTVPGSPSRLPEALRERLHPRVVYFWRVEALDEQGARLAWSELIRFRARSAALQEPSSPHD
jgi:hypothetical protein